jgi:hypothetical protein
MFKIQRNFDLLDKVDKVKIFEVENIRVNIKKIILKGIIVRWKRKINEKYTNDYYRTWNSIFRTYRLRISKCGQ